MNDEIPTPDVFKPGAVLNKKYRILEAIGEGGMGAVVKAERIPDNVILAIKWCRLAGSDWQRRFMREVKLTRRIEHPHIVPIVACNFKHDPPYFVMPFAEGSIRSKLSEYAADEPRALVEFWQLCEGVQAIHNAGAVHRDIKPDNALIIGGHVAVADLGLAKLCERDTTILTQTVAVLGTQMYLAPEQRLPGGSRDADRRTDVFQLGKTLYQMFTTLDPLLVDLSKVSPGLGHIIRKATQEHPNQRYQTVAEMIDAVKIYQQSKDPASHPTAAFEASLSRINARLKYREFRQSDIKPLLATMSLRDVRNDKAKFLEMFDCIPKTILHVCASQMQDEFVPVLQGYLDAIDSEVAGKSFGYAETVADKMGAVFLAPSSTPQIKSLALEATLIAAVWLNRYAAIDAFNSMLTVTTDEADAFEVAEMLRRRQDVYRRICTGIPSIRLHPAIRAVRDEFANQGD